MSDKSATVPKSERIRRTKTKVACSEEMVRIIVRGAIPEGKSETMEGRICKTGSNWMESTLREYKSPRKRFCRQHLATLATPTILRPASSEFPD